MTDLIPGKRYRVTHEGTFTADGYLVDDDGQFVGKSVSGKWPKATVELLPDPLPTTPGSVVRWKQWSGELRTLSRETGRLPWRDVNSPHLCFSDEEVQGATVLFDVGP